MRAGADRKVMKLVSFLVGFLSAALAGCAPVETTPTAPEPVTITLSRGVCFGFCPDYTVSIDQSGLVTYEGRRFVAVTGRQTARIAPADVRRLLDRFDAANFMRLRDDYRANVSDLPTYTVVLARGGVRKRVTDYGGLHAGMPQAVRDLQNEIDRVAGTAQWVLRDGQPVRDGQR
jgi:hypothetical protein